VKSSPTQWPSNDLLRSCRICPHQCGVDRLRGEKGICGLGENMRLARALPHHGEEPPLSGTKGAGTLFFSSCNLRCRFCQNDQISHHVVGEELSPPKLASYMLRLQEQGCHNIEAVTPTPQLPQLIASLQIAKEQGLTLPFVYNCSGYENPDMIRLLDGWVDIYLPDFKYGDEENAFAFSGIRNYSTYALASLKEMTKQVGYDLLLDANDVATKGIIIRHLVLPGCTENSIIALSLLRNHFPSDIPISLMSQYTPTASVRNHPLLKQRITKSEYELVVNYALDKGFEQLFIQEVDDRNICPDFYESTPFHWLDHDES